MKKESKDFNEIIKNLSEEELDELLKNKKNKSIFAKDLHDASGFVGKINRNMTIIEAVYSGIAIVKNDDIMLKIAAIAAVVFVGLTALTYLGRKALKKAAEKNENHIEAIKAQISSKGNKAFNGFENYI